MPSNKRQLHVDALIIGGGIAGLWTLHTLTSAGYSAVLIESRALGAGQTGASQGIIHGGLKYALGGVSTAASRAIAEMPTIWRRCMSEPLPGDPDLRQARLLSRHQHLFTAPGILARIGAAAGSLALRTNVERIARDAPTCPECLRAAPGSVDVYRVDEPVLEVTSILGAFRDSLASRILFATRPAAGSGWSLRELKNNSTHVGAVLMGLNTAVEITARRCVLTAGAGNEGLLRELGIDAERHGLVLQRRPLHMVMMAGAPGRLFAHCIGASVGPRLTITSGELGADGPVWYIGGQVAEDGVDRTEADQVSVTRRELSTTMPWLNFDRTRMAACRWDRAEAAPSSRNGKPGQRPDEPVILESGPVLAAWPIKLAFAPLLAERLLERVGTPGGTTAEGAASDDELSALIWQQPVAAPLALPPWCGSWNPDSPSGVQPVKWLP